MAPLAGRVGELAFAKQSAEGTPNTTPAFGVPFVGGGLDIDQTINPLAVTDASAVDVVGEWKEMMAVKGQMQFLAVPQAIGLPLLGAFGGDVVTGAGPNYTHTFTFGTDDSALSWLTFFQKVGSGTPGTRYDQFTDCKVDTLALGWDSGKPIVVDLGVKGKVPAELASPYSAPTTAEGLAKLLAYQGATMKFDEDATPAATQHRNITACKLTITRALILQQTDALTPQYVFSPTYGIDIEMDVWYEDAKFVRSTYFGSSAGLTASNVLVYGAIDWLATYDANTSLQIKVPNARFSVPLPPAVPNGQPVTLKVTGKAVKPSSGSLGTAVLKNQTASY